jgi:D-threo-aldose 1-dehydrogenase
VPPEPSAPAATPIGFGTAPIGLLYAAVPDAQAQAALEAAWDAGIRYFDTAPLYGHGLAELRLGRFLADKRRDSYVVSTKVGRLVDASAQPGDSLPFDYSRDGVRRSLAGSLGRLGLDYVDIALVHDPDSHWEEASRVALPELVRMRDAGLARALGAGMNQAEMLHRFVVECDVDCVLVAGRYTLLDRGAERQLLPACLERGVAVILGGVFNSGILADPETSATFDYQPAPPAILARARELQGVCERFGVPLAAAAIQFARSHPAVTAVLTGARSPSEVEENVKLLDLEIPAALWDAIAETAQNTDAG